MVFERSTDNQAVWTRIKKIFNYFLQTKDQIQRAVQEIVNSAVDENVKCNGLLRLDLVYLLYLLYFSSMTDLELVVRPSGHIQKGLSQEQVVQATLEAIKTQTENKAIRCGVVIYASPENVLLVFSLCVCMWIYC